jgi:UDP-N-acetyl-alpha-D-muramoyl-L-alanyl-L-glutamate epimerase
MVHTRFIFESYTFQSDKRRIELKYSLDGEVHFTEVIEFGADFVFEEYDHQALDRALFALHLAGGASYYKTYCPKEIVIQSGVLNQKEAMFWNTLYTKGLGEFFYRNRLDFHDLISFPVGAETHVRLDEVQHSAELPQRVLVPFGGGKDSVVSAELLRANDITETLFRVNGHAIIDELAETAALPLLTIRRTLSPELHRLNEQGALNGHIPITAYITFLSMVVAMLGGYEAVVFSNERSADYGNVLYLGMEINHQWSKSAEAEDLLRAYIRQSIGGPVRYMNPLRALSELHIVKLFTRYPQYFSEATSCNRNWRLLDDHPQHNKWCGECPKCAFVFALMAAFLPMEKVSAIFGKNLFEDKSLLGLYRQLWGIEGFKPFECVGTPEETQAAFYLATQRSDYAQTYIGKLFMTDVLPLMADPASVVDSLLMPSTGSLSSAERTILEKGMTT